MTRNDLPIYTRPNYQVQRIIEKHVRWYLRKTGRPEYISRFTDRLYLGIALDTTGRAGGALYGVHHFDHDRQEAYIRKVWKTRVSRIRKFCHPDLIEWYLVTHCSEPLTAISE